MCAFDFQRLGECTLCLVVKSHASFLVTGVWVCCCLGEPQPRAQTRFSGAVDGTRPVAPPITWIPCEPCGNWTAHKKQQHMQGLPDRSLEVPPPEQWPTHNAAVTPHPAPHANRATQGDVCCGRTGTQGHSKVRWRMWVEFRVSIFVSMQSGFLDTKDNLLSSRQCAYALVISSHQGLIPGPTRGIIN